MNIPIRDRLSSRNDLRPGLYARVSTDDQARNGFSIPSQIKMGKDLVHEKEWLIRENIEVFVDDGISGTHENRPQFNKLKEAIKNKSVNLLIITDTDRISRETYISQNFANLLMKHGVELYVITDPTLDIYTASGMLQFTIKSAFNTYEVRKTRASAMRGIIQSFEQGNYANPGAPYGYTKKKKKLYINNDESEVVQLIHELYIEADMSIPKVVEYLRINQYNTGKRTWSEFSVRRVLESPVYIGHVHRDDLNRTFYNIAPKIITEDIKERVYKLLKERKRSHKGVNKHLFYRKVRCKDCDNICINDTSSKGYRYYICSKCLKRFSEVKLDDQIAFEFSIELLKRINIERSDSAKKQFKVYQKREQIINELYIDERISKQSFKYEKKLISQERRVFIKTVSVDINSNVDWYGFSIALKKKYSKSILEEIVVSMDDKSVRTIKFKQDKQS
ncbi:recombinase family protein [Erysipelothrix anatis]|uniref:recombinase family protein n=1 Tax=Erysipelothrix anatis TaxID=2683713 RepID=UPI0014091B4B|nr:recombinase family protein [Erysipelothrix anatis]